MKTIKALSAVVALLATLSTRASPFAVETVISGLPVHSGGDRNVFATPFDYRDSTIITVHVEDTTPAGKEGVNLRTVLRKGMRQSDASWKWESHVIEDRTMLDSWHTQASVAFDKNGFVHVAYNMHNFPWQYSVSNKPFDITEFSFKGQPISLAEIERAKFHNKTSFPDIGNAAIPGNQITYPMFFKDQNGDLFVTYRFAVRPARDWEHRAFGAGIARYDVAKRTWKPIGGTVRLAPEDAKPMPTPSSAALKPFAFEDGYTVYLPTLAFDKANGMHVFWNWRVGEAGMETERPSYAYTADGVKFASFNGREVSLPVNYEHSPSVTGANAASRYYAAKSVAITADGAPIAILQPTSGGRELWTLDRATGRFTREESPQAASAIVVDKQGRQWAFATGLRVFMREGGTAQWKEQGEIGPNLCNPKVAYYPDESRFVVHAKNCANDSATIVTFRR